jgi:phosphoglycerate dehydrogenase-like enzyme
MLTSVAPRLSATTLDRLLLTPHLGYVTEKTWQLFYGDTLEAIEAFAAGAPIRTL